MEAVAIIQLRGDNKISFFTFLFRAWTHSRVLPINPALHYLNYSNSSISAEEFFLTDC